MVVTVEKFIEGLTRSGLMTAEEVHAFQVTLPPDIHPPSVQSLAAELVRRGRLTRYQAARIASGRPEGLVLDKYVILDKIGEGGMGEVFFAEHRRMKRPVVVKVLPPSATESEYSIRRFQREVEAAAQLHHPNIVTAFDADEENGVHFLVMEYVEGEPLGLLVTREGPFPIEKAVSCVLQAARGLEYAHSKGIVHRDIKPNNLLLDSSGTVKILDMGLARFDEGRASRTLGDGDGLTQDNQIIGTIEYMSPEQVDDSSKVDRRSDIYSLGCTLFRLLTDRPPYQGESVIQTLVAHRVEPIPSVRAQRPDAPEGLELIFQRMMAKVPEDRYQSMTEVIRDLEACLGEIGRASDFASAAWGDADARLSQADTAEIEVGTIAPSPRFSETCDEATVDCRTDQDTPSPLVLAKGDSRKLRALPLPAVGIDLGTTHSAIAHLDDAGRPQVLANIEGDKTTPSVVLIEDSVVVVGKEAVKAMGTDMGRIAECAKRDLGCRAYHQPIHGREYPPEVIQAWVLNKLRDDAQTQIGQFTKVVITVPAYFDEVRRKATQDAGYIAGLEVLDIINEPTAAALAFGFQHGRLRRDEDRDEPIRVLVYDLGGGTFDVTIMEIGSGEFVTLATDGDVRLGGRDWDERLVDFAAESFLHKHNLDPRQDLNSLGRLLRECEDAKRTLSARQKAHVWCELQGKSERIEITRAKFQEITQDLLERTAFTTRHALETVGLGWDDIDRVLLVGGATRMPAVTDLLRRLSGKEPDATVSPDEAVAQGAAIHAGLLLEKVEGRAPRVRVRNVNSHSLGVAGTDPQTKRKQTAFLIPRNTPLPAKAKRVFKTLKSGQKSIVVHIVEGESMDPRECMQIGKCTVRSLPDNLPAGTPVEVRFQYQENGRLRIAVNVAGVGENISHEITRANNLKKEELDRWRRRVAGLPTAAS